MPVGRVQTRPVPTRLTRAQHLAGLQEAASALVAYAGRAGLDAPVPTCPGWSVRDLVAHVERGRDAVADALADDPGTARRQCHEVTVHAVDALAASLGRAPRVDEVWIDPDLAADGIDELLGGALPRWRARLRCAEFSLLVVRPTDVADWWQVELGPRPPVVTRSPAGGAAEADWELTGTAVELYLRLWNRLEPTPAWP